MAVVQVLTFDVGATLLERLWLPEASKGDVFD